jgi:hypothetical protein
VTRLAWPAVLLVACTLGACTLLGPRVKPANNDRCHVCHINYAEERFAVTHARHGVGCEKCHGQSDDHCGSESHEIAPERIYARDAVRPACLQCHDPKTLAGQEMHTLNLVTTPQAKKVCTDCHSTHRLERRTVRWDKATRKLLPSK